MGRVRSYLLAVVCAGMVLLGAIPLLALPAARDAEPSCVDGWATLPSMVYPDKMRVWATCTGAYEGDLREMLGTAERLWGPMIEFMGIEPLPDKGTASAGGDTAIDFHLADQETGHRAGLTGTLERKHSAAERKGKPSTSRNSVLASHAGTSSSSPWRCCSS